MRFTRTAVPGVLIIEPEPHFDVRGFFARMACADEFAAEGMASTFAQVNVTWNERAGTLRGLHVQKPPHAEGKLVRCVRGAIFDVAVDARDESPTRWQHASAVLTAENRRMLYLPPGCAHGYQALEDSTEVITFHSVPYAPGAEAGFRWDDPALAIPWPDREPILSEKDRAQPLLAVRDAVSAHIP